MRLRDRLGLKRRLAELGRGFGWHVVRSSRYDLVRRDDYYSPLADLDAVPESVWNRRSPLVGVYFNLEEQFRWAEKYLAPLTPEFAPNLEPSPVDDGFYLRNWTFQAGDAEVLYAIIRHAKPRRIVELGSGFTTLLMAHAVVMNRRDSHETYLYAYNPFPPPQIDGRVIDGLAAHYDVPAQDVPEETFTSLEENDVLFVDTTHTVKIGGEVNRVILDVLPVLRPGVLVHFHDIFLPFEYPEWLLRRMAPWNEQYLLQASLVGNDRFEVLLGLHAMARTDPDRLETIAPLYNSRDHFPTSFWIRSR